MRYLFYIFLWLFFVSAIAGNTLYQWTDEDGQIHVSDQPEANAKPVQLPKLQTYQLRSSTTNINNNATESDTSFQPQKYTAIHIITPKNQETIRDNSGNVSVNIQLAPKLFKNNQYQLFLDGKMYKKKQITSQFQLKNMDRGEHSLEAVIVNENNQILIRSAKIVFYLHQNYKKNKSK